MVAPTKWCRRLGLSPRVRGNRGAFGAVASGSGSIPARAGEPHSRWRMPTFPKVYPRACGGTAAGVFWRCHGPGLSPRVRGNPAACGLRSGSNGSIPARAGEPTGILKENPRRSVYPRACGGTETDDGKFYVLSGLSPRVRGNRYRQRLAPCQPRSIPARAGEPMSQQRRGMALSVYPRACGGTRR